ncbi:MAG: carboxylesterase family protein [Deltaproteobacteria bacterium]|nr:carboxylesterase family protein [Deltaproteobacteria bacterium]
MRNLVISLLLGLFISFSQGAFAAEEGEMVNVETPKGAYVGKVVNGVQVFKGIPFALSTEGEGRFAPPRDLPPHKEPFQALEYGPSVWQPTPLDNSFGLKPGSPLSEDSLRLNIWVPTENPDGALLPVYVFIHGGGFGLGSGSHWYYEGTTLAKEGVVVVTINYRLGALGFLATKETLNRYGTTGNWGIMDQIKALEWVRDNIKAFGGDPEKVTIGGESAGAMSVSILTLSPLAKGLFRGAILESGTVFTVYGYPLTYGSLERAVTLGDMFLNSLRLKDDSLSLDKIREMSPSILANMCPFTADWTVISPFSFFPVPDGKVIPKVPQDNLASGDFNQVKLLMGFNGDESSIFLTNMDEPESAKSMVTEYLGPDVVQAFFDKYQPKSDEEVYDLVRRLMTMGIFTAGSKRVADLHSKFQDVYLFRFEYVSDKSKSEKLGAFHTSELPYVFGYLDKEGLTKDSEKKLSEDIRTRWVNFIKTGDPNQGKSPPTEAPWPRYTRENPQALHIDTDLKAAPLAEADDMELISDLLFGKVPGEPTDTKK